MLGSKIGQAGASLDGLSARVAEQERVSQRMFAEIDRGLTLIGERFAELSAHGDDRANHFLGSLTRARAELDALAEQAGTQDSSIEALAERTAALRQGIDQLTSEIRDGLASAIGDAESGAERVLARDRERQARDRLDARRRGRGERADRRQRRRHRRAAGPLRGAAGDDRRRRRQVRDAPRGADRGADRRRRARRRG